MKPGGTERRGKNRVTDVHALISLSARTSGPYRVIIPHKGIYHTCTFVQAKNGTIKRCARLDFVV
jgi:hypothetical protein